MPPVEKQLIPDHMIIMPIFHTGNFMENPFITEYTMYRAAEFARDRHVPCNIYSSSYAQGRNQLFHLTIHYFPKTDEPLDIQTINAWRPT